MLTKFDRVLARASEAERIELDDPSGVGVERLVEQKYGMTRHALAQHAPPPRGAIFAVSSYGHDGGNGRPPTELQPLGLEGPLSWLADQLETIDEDQLEWLWDLAPNDLPRLERAVASYEKRYPKSERAERFRARLNARKRQARRKRMVRLVAVAALFFAGLAGYDAWGFHSALAFEAEQENPATAVARRWSEVMAWHPSMSLFWPARARRARIKLAEWTVKAAEIQVANGTDADTLGDTLTNLKDQDPRLAPAIRKIEDARELARHDERWTVVKADALAPTDDPEPPLAGLRAFLKEFPDSPRRADAMALINTLKKEVSSKRSVQDRRFVDDLVRAEGLPNAELRDLIDRARQFLADHPSSDWRAEVEGRLEGYVRALDERDIERARQYSRQNPTNFAARIDRFQDYLRGHQTGGRYVSEATEAKDRVLREWDNYSYRLAYDHFMAHPDDVAEVARRLRDYLHEHKDGRYASDAQQYLAWWDKVSVPSEYRVTLRRGEVEPTVGKYLSGGAPDLGVEIDVAGVTHGPSPVVPNSRRPIWDYTFPRPVRWKLGDPVTIRIIDFDWGDSVVYTFTTRKGDPLAIRKLSGTVTSSKGGRTLLTFASDFVMPTLSAPAQ